MSKAMKKSRSTVSKRSSSSCNRTISSDSSFSSESVMSRKRKHLVPRVYLDIMKANDLNVIVTVKSARHLYDDHCNGVDSYVRIHIAGQPPETDWVTYTRIQDPNPVYNESYTIEMTNIINRSSLQVSVWSVSHDSHQCMGCMAFPFYTINVMNKRLLGWFALLDTTLGQSAFCPFVSLDCRVSENSEVGAMAEMQLTINAETLEVNRRKAVVDLVNFKRKYLISIVNKYKIHCKCLKSNLSTDQYKALFYNLELVIQTQINMFDYVKYCYNGKYAIGSVLRSWVPELVCLIDFQRNKEHVIQNIQGLELADFPIIKKRSSEYTQLFSMPLTYLKTLSRHIKDVHYYTLDRHPDYSNITWVQEYIYWLIVQVESPQRISHNHTLRHASRAIDRSFTFSMPADYHDETEDEGEGGVGDLTLVEYDLGVISSVAESVELDVDTDITPPPEQDVSENVLMEEELEWPVTPPPDELEMDDEVLLTSQKTASLAKTLDQVIEVFSTVSRKKPVPPSASPLPDSSNWKTIQKLVLPSDDSNSEQHEKPDEVQDEEEAEEEEFLHISVDPGSSAFYQTSPNCIGSSNSVTRSPQSPPHKREAKVSKILSSKSATFANHNMSPNMEIQRIYAVKSLNDIVFSEEEYDIAAV